MGTRIRTSSAPYRQSLSIERLRRTIDAAQDFERRTMRIYCRFLRRFSKPDEVRAFWLDMAQRESHHLGALALIAGLLDESPQRDLRGPTPPSGTRVENIRALLDRVEAKADEALTLRRALELALEIECSEIEDLLLDLLNAFRGELERERAVRLLIHDLGDLSYMIEKYTKNQSLLARADHLIEHEVRRLRRRTPERPRSRRRRSVARAARR